MDKVVIDTSVWIESLRPQGDAELGHMVRDLILNGRVLLPGIIKVELLRGAKNKKEYKMLHEVLKGLTYLPVQDSFWDKLAEFSFELFRKGVSVPLTDTYIALACIENKAPLLHRDQHFDLIATHSDLELLGDIARK